MKIITETTETGFNVIFKIDSEEEAIEFHDRVAIKICNGPHEFIGNISNRIKPNKYYPEDTEYEI